MAFQEIQVLAWSMHGPDESVWMLYVPSSTMEMAVRIHVNRLHDGLTVDAHHIGGSCKESALRWTRHMEERGMQLGPELHVAEVPYGFVQRAQHDALNGRDESREPRGGPIGTLLRETTERSVTHSWVA